MKSNLNTIKTRSGMKGLLIVVLLIATAFSPSKFFAQDENSNADDKKKEESTMVSPSLEFYTVQKGDNTIDFRGRLQARVNDANKKLPHLRIRFVAMNGEEEKPLGYAITNINGKAVLNIKSDMVPADAKGDVIVKAIYEGTDLIEGAEEELTFRKARLQIEPIVGDSVHSVKVTLVDLSSGTVTTVPETDLGVFISRSFNPLKVADATTDESGEAVAVIPDKLPGDADGNLNIMVKLDEHELYGFMEASTIQKWGDPLEFQIKRNSRQLWTAHPPLWMLVTFIILITVVWGHYIVIIWELFRLRREESAPKS